MAAPEWQDANLLHKVDGRRGVFDAVSVLTTLQKPTFVWRGHVSSDWTLKPAAHRRKGIADQADTLKDQLELIRKARVRRHDQLAGWEMPDLALLARLQHNGAATVLMDVTTDPFVALYFACEQLSSSENEDGLLLAIDVSASGRTPRTKHYDLGHDATLEEVFADLGGKLGLYAPPDVSPRIMAQRGRFILGAHKDLGYATLPVQRSDWDAAKLKNVFAVPRPIGQPAKPAIVAIEIKAKLKPQLREILDQSFGMNAVTLFPDMHGFAAAHRVW